MIFYRRSLLMFLACIVSLKAYSDTFSQAFCTNDKGTVMQFVCCSCSYIEKPSTIKGIGWIAPDFHNCFRIAQAKGCLATSVGSGCDRMAHFYDSNGNDTNKTLNSLCKAGTLRFESEL